MKEVDIYIKDEGYMDVRLHRSLKAQEFCHSLGIKNSLIDIGDTYCGEVVWKPGCKDKNAMFSFVLSKDMHDVFINECKKVGLTVASEFSEDFD